MTLAEKLKKLRTEKGLTQDQLAKEVGVSLRTINGYEAGRYPRTRKTYEKLASILECPVDYLYTQSEDFIFQASDRYGSRGKKQAEDAVNTLSAMFAGGQLSEPDKDAVIKALMEVYWDVKEDNKKYTPNKFKFRDENGDSHKGE